MATKTAVTPTPPAYSEGAKVVLYAKWGGKKTLQIASLIEDFGVENVLVVNAEGGLRTIESKLAVKDNIIRVNSLAELQYAFRPDGPIRSFATGLDKYICLDGGSRVVTWIANEELNGADRFYEQTKKGAPIDANDLQYGRYMQKGEINSMAVYNKVGRRSETLWNAWVGLNANLYVNFLEEKVGQSGFEKTFPYGPDVPGKVGLDAVMSTFDFVGRLTHREDGTLIGQFDPTNYMYMAKTRDDRSVVTVPGEIANFRLADFIKLVRGERVLEAAKEAGK